MKRLSRLVLLPLALFVATSCEVEFSPNASWKEVPVIYCVLDQDDDTTWARVERCYLGEDDIRTYASTSDSFNYPDGALQVSLIAYLDGVAVDSLPFSRATRDRATGSFAHTAQPDFYCPTRGRLDDRYTYRIRVRRAADGSLLAQNATPIPLVVKNPADSLITRPFSGRRFDFKDGNYTCQIDWNSLANARLYQPVIRLYYAVGADTTYVDVKCQQVTSRNEALNYSIHFPKSTFLASVREQLRDDTVPKQYLSMVDILLLACSEDLRAYLYSVGGNSNSDRPADSYSNIENGLGVFAARRTHLYKRMPADDSMLQGGLLKDLKDLNVGF